MKLFYGICPREMSNHDHHYNMFDHFENSVQLRKKKKEYKYNILIENDVFYDMK